MLCGIRTKNGKNAVHERQREPQETGQFRNRLDPLIGTITMIVAPCRCEFCVDFVELLPGGCIVTDGGSKLVSGFLDAFYAR